MTIVMVNGDGYYVDIIHKIVLTEELFEQIKKDSLSWKKEHPNERYPEEYKVRIISKKYFPNVREDGTIENFDECYANFLNRMAEVKKEGRQHFETSTKIVPFTPTNNTGSKSHETQVSEGDVIDILDLITKRKENEKMYYGQHTNNNQGSREMNQETAERMREEARKKSHTAQTHAAARNPEAQEEVPAKKKHNAKQIISAILLTISLLAAGAGGKYGVDAAVTGYQTNQVAEIEAEMMVPRGAEHTPDILKRNEFSSNNHQTRSYDNQHIADEIYTLLPDEAITTTMYSLYDLMDPQEGDYIDNYSRVIAALAEKFVVRDEAGYIKSEESLTQEELQKIQAAISSHPQTYAQYGGCNNFTDYLIKHGFVDKDGNVDVSQYVAFGKNSVRTQYGILKNINEQYQNGALDLPVLDEEVQESLKLR